MLLTIKNGVKSISAIVTTLLLNDLHIKVLLLGTDPYNVQGNRHMKSRKNEEVISTAQADAGQTDPRQRLDVDGTSMTEIWDAARTETGLPRRRQDRHKKNVPERLVSFRDVYKCGSDLLSHLVGQYHRRARA